MKVLFNAELPFSFCPRGRVNHQIGLIDVSVTIWMTKNRFLIQSELINLFQYFMPRLKLPDILRSLSYVPSRHVPPAYPLVYGQLYDIFYPSHALMMRVKLRKLASLASIPPAEKADPPGRSSSSRPSSQRMR